MLMTLTVDDMLVMVWFNWQIPELADGVQVTVSLLSPTTTVITMMCWLLLKGTPSML